MQLITQQKAIDNAAIVSFILTGSKYINIMTSTENFLEIFWFAAECCQSLCWVGSG